MSDARPLLRTGSELCLYGAITFAVASFGGAAPWALIPFAVLSALALICAVLSTDQLRLPALSFPLLVGGALCLAQLLPLPLALLRVFSPPAAELVSFNLEPLGLGTFRPISLDSALTFGELAKSLAYLALFLSAAQLAESRRFQKRAAFFAAGLGTAIALTGAGHALVNATSLFGLHTFSAMPPVLTPFGDSNHLAGFLTVTATVTLALIISERTPPLRLALGGAYLLQAVITAFSSSRAGMVFFVLAQLLLVALVLRSPERGRQKLARAPIAALAALVVIAAAAYVAWDRIGAEYESANSVEKLRESKIALWPEFAHSALGYSRLGMGRGTFELGFPRFQSKPSYYLFTHPENQVLQLWSELGIPAALLLLALAAFGLWTLTRRGEQSNLDHAAIASAVAVSAHNLFDFSFELLAVPSVLLLLLGIASRRSDRPTKVKLARARLPFAFAAVALCLLGATLARHTPRDAEAELEKLLSERAPATKLKDAALPLIDRHPADALLYTMVGLAYANDRAEDPRVALAWLNRGLLLSPWQGPAHQAAARALLRLGKRNQAFSEYRLAMESYAGVYQVNLVGEALQRAKTADEVTRLTPRNPALVDRIAIDLWNWQRHADAEGLLVNVIPELPESAAASLRLRLASFYVGDGKATEAMAEIDLAEKSGAAEVAVAIARAQALNAAGKGAEAATALETQLARHPGEGELHLALARQYLSNRDVRKATEAAVRARPFIVNPPDRVQLFLLEAQAYESEGRFARALDAVQSAARLAPADPQLRYRVADLYAQLGRYDDARKWLAEGAAVDTEQGAATAKKRLDTWGDAQNRAIEKQVMESAGQHE